MKNEKIIVRPDNVFKSEMPVFVSHTQTVSCPIHRHEFYEIDLFVCGTGVSSVETASLEITRPTCLLNFPYTTHSFKADKGSFEIYNIAFSDRFVSKECMNYIYRLESSPCISLGKDELEILRRDAELLYADYMSNVPMKSERIRTRLEAMLIYIISRTPQDNSRGDLTPIQAALAYISRNLDKKITATELAALVHVSPGYFGTYFKNNYGKSHKAYITELRMKNAMSLLLSTDNSITAISEECGFVSVSNFIKAFKEYWGEHPLDCRKNRESENNK